MTNECPLGSGLANSLNVDSTGHRFRTFNLQDNGRDVVDVRRGIAGEQTPTVDGRLTRPADLFPSATEGERRDRHPRLYDPGICPGAPEAFRASPDCSAAKHHGIRLVFIDGPSDSLRARDHRRLQEHQGSLNNTHLA